MLVHSVISGSKSKWGNALSQLRAPFRYCPAVLYIALTRKWTKCLFQFQINTFQWTDCIAYLAWKGAGSFLAAMSKKPQTPVKVDTLVTFGPARLDYQFCVFITTFVRTPCDQSSWSVYITSKYNWKSDWSWLQLAFDHLQARVRPQKKNVLLIWLG